MFQVLDLFSGIGGFTLGLERTGGFKTVAFCEIEPFPRRVLAKHWPGIHCYEDVRTLTADTLHRDGITADVICGGFPCQDISFAGRGEGIGGGRSGLWKHYARLIGEIRPRYVIVENVAALLNRGLSVVLGDLASIGYDAEWDCIPASAVGAPHQRDRLWLVAHPSGERSLEERENCGRTAQWFGSRMPILAYAKSCAARQSQPGDSREETEGGWSDEASSPGRRHRLFGRDDWHTEPGICRVVDGISANVDRDSALGNAIVPQIAELIGNSILAAEVA